MLSKLPTAFFVFLLLSSAIALHLQSTTEAQIQALVAQQTKFQGIFENLLANVTSLEKQIEGSSDTDQKILLLENAIISERESVFELSKTIIPPFNISKQSCEKMTDQQKVELLEQLQKARAQVNDLKNLTETMPECDEVDQIKRDIEKQLFFLDSIESIIYTNCSMNVVLSPTIWQSNIYATGWILGQLTIDDLIEQYYQRSIRYDNVTNCPIETPFFDGTKCMICKDPTPVFDISQKKCVACPEGEHVEDTQKQCIKDVYYTNWTSLDPPNYSPSNGPFPDVPENALVCPEQTPYFSSQKTCIQCPLPKYFDVLTSECKSCEADYSFDMEEQKCVKADQFKLTKLYGTRWVTERPVQDVLQERLDLISDPVNGDKYKECPEETPYYDGIICIDCPNQFDIEKRECTQAPDAHNFYDDNTHSYVEPKTIANSNDTTDYPYIGTKPEYNPDIHTCPVETPFYDGITCIKCPSPFIIFDFDTKKCVICSPEDVYDEATHTCVPRQVIYISTNEDKLLATDNKTVDQYHDDITKVLEENPDAIILNCEDPKEYSNYSACMPCAEDEYFNVELLECQICEGEYNETTQKCVLPAQIFTNLSDPNIVNLPEDLQSEQDQIDEQLAKNNESYVCPMETPYSDGEKCFDCNEDEEKYFFDYQAKECIGCPNGTSYSNSSQKCVPPAQIFTNLSDPNIVNLPEDLQSEQDQIDEQLAKNNDSYVCPMETPYSDGEKCFDCNEDEEKYFFDYKTKECIGCPEGTYYTKSSDLNTSCVEIPLVSNIPAIEDQNKYLEKQPDSTLAKMNESITNLTDEGIPYKECPAETPYFNESTESCAALCQEENYVFDIATEKCVLCETYDATTHSCPPPIPRYPNLTNTDWIVNDNDTKRIYEWRNDLREVNGSVECDASIEFYNNATCVGCPEGTYYNFDTFMCQYCDDPYAFDINLHACLEKAPEGAYQTSLSSPNLVYGGYPENQWKDEYNQRKVDYPGIEDCPPQHPYYDGIACIMCPEYLPYFNMRYNLCQACPEGSTYDATRHECLNEGTVEKTYPNVPKMYANIF